MMDIISFIFMESIFLVIGIFIFYYVYNKVYDTKVIIVRKTGSGYIIDETRAKYLAKKEGEITKYVYKLLKPKIEVAVEPESIYLLKPRFLKPSKLIFLSKSSEYVPLRINIEDKQLENIPFDLKAWLIHQIEETERKYPEKEKNIIQDIILPSAVIVACVLIAVAIYMLVGKLPDLITSLKSLSETLAKVSTTAATKKPPISPP